MTGYISEVRTSNGTYYVGMTKQQAQQQNIFECKIGIDFKDLDTDNSGDLDQREILVGAINQYTRNSVFDAFNTCLMVASTGLAVAGSACTAGAATPLAVAGASGSAIWGGITAEDVTKYKQAVQQLEEYDKEHNIAQNK